MTDIVEALKTASEYLKTKDGYTARKIDSHIADAEEEKTLGDLSRVRKAYISAEVGCNWHGDEFEELSVNFKKWLKAFYDAAMGEAAPEFIPGDHVIVTGDSMNSGHSFAAGTRGIVRAKDNDESYRVEYLNGSDYWYVHPNDMKRVPKFNLGDRVRAIADGKTVCGDYCAIRKGEVGVIASLDDSHTCYDSGNIQVTRGDKFGQWIDPALLELAIEPRVWDDVSDIPENVTMIRDCDGDTWGRGADYRDADYTWPVANVYAPYTEVVK